MNLIIQLIMIVIIICINRIKKLADEQGNVIFGGRLGHYRYYDMHQVIGAALQCVRNELD